MKATVRIALSWAQRCFGVAHVANRQVRALRCAEEAVELAQATGVSREKMIELVGIVYQRPPGDVYQEMGGVLMTVNVMAAGMNIDPEQAFEDELIRVLAKPAEHFTQRNRAKIEAGLDAQ